MLTGRSMWMIFYYGKERVGFGISIKYRLSQQTVHDVDFSLSVDGVKALLTKVN